MENKVKAKYAIGKHRYKWIYVKESEVEVIMEFNRMSWRQDDKEKRERKRQKKLGIMLCSLEALEENGEVICGDYIDPLEAIIDAEDREEIAECIGGLLKSLAPRQQKMVDMIYFKNKSQDEVAGYFGVNKQAISNAMQRIYIKLKKILK